MHACSTHGCAKFAVLAQDTTGTRLCMTCKRLHVRGLGITFPSPHLVQFNAFQQKIIDEYVQELQADAEKNTALARLDPVRGVRLQWTAYMGAAKRAYVRIPPELYTADTPTVRLLQHIADSVLPDPRDRCRVEDCTFVSVGRGGVHYDLSEEGKTIGDLWRGAALFENETAPIILFERKTIEDEHFGSINKGRATYIQLVYLYMLQGAYMHLKEAFALANSDTGLGAFGSHRFAEIDKTLRRLHAVSDQVLFPNLVRPTPTLPTAPPRPLPVVDLVRESDSEEDDYMV